jgi:type I restriction enzyme M protein
MWRRVAVQNFRSLADVTVDIAPFTVVVGPNGSGKSSFADVFVFGSELAADAASAVERRGGIVGLRRWSPTKPYALSVDIRIARSRGGLRAPTVRHQFTLNSGRDGAWSFSREELVAKDVHITRKAEKVRVEGEELLWRIPAPDQSILSSVRAAGLRALTSVRPLRSVRRIRPNPDLMRPPRIADDRRSLTEGADNVTVAFRSLPDSKREGIIATMARIVPGLRNIQIEPFDRYLILRFVQEQHSGKAATFSATEMSDGALRALGILTALAQMTKDQLLVIEEPEVSVHPGAARLLYEALKEASGIGSVLVTTHSADLLDAAADDEILVCRYDRGQTRVGPLAQAQRDIVREGLFSLAELVRSEPLRIEGDEPSLIES